MLNACLLRQMARLRMASETSDSLDAPRRFALNLDEVSGALGDLGTFLPHIIGAVTVVGMNPSGIFMTFGLLYLSAGAFYGVPWPFNR